MLGRVLQGLDHGFGLLSITVQAFFIMFVLLVLYSLLQLWSAAARVVFGPLEEDVVIEAPCPPATKRPHLRANRVKARRNAAGQQCVICLTEITSDVGRLPCGHSFHYKCINTWLRRSPSCPMRCELHCHAPQV